VTVERIEVYNIYVLVRENVYRAIAEVVRNIPRTKNVIMMGDFNYTFVWNNERETRPRLDN